MAVGHLLLLHTLAGAPSRVAGEAPVLPASRPMALAFTVHTPAAPPPDGKRSEGTPPPSQSSSPSRSSQSHGTPADLSPSLAGLSVDRAPAASPAPNPAPNPAPDPATPAASLPSAEAQPAAALLPTRVPPPFRLAYAVHAQVRGRPMEGQAELSWRHDGARYEVLWAVRGPPALARTLQSVGRLGPQGLGPERFSQSVRSEQAVHFDRAGERLVFSGGAATVPLLTGAQDRLSVLLQVAAAVAARPGDWPAGSRLMLPVATTQALEAWTFVIEGLAPTPPPSGGLTALHLSRAPAGPFGPRMDLWLAPDLDYAPVRLRLTQGPADWIEYVWPGTDRP